MKHLILAGVAAALLASPGLAQDTVPGLATGHVLAQPVTPGNSDDSAQEQLDTPPPRAPGEPAIPSFQRGSGTRAGGPANELNTGDDRARVQLPEGDAAAAIAGTNLYHGNFCGAGNRGDDVPPTDELDAACKRHDECFDATNRACSCNEPLRRDAYRVSELKSASRELRARAAAVLEAIPGIQCRGP